MTKPHQQDYKKSWRNTKDESRKEENVSTQTTLDATPLLKWKFRRQPRKSIIIRTWNHKPEFVKRVFWEWSFPSIFVVDFLWILHSFVSYLHWKGVILGNKWDDRTIWQSNLEHHYVDRNSLCIGKKTSRYIQWDLFLFHLGGTTMFRVELETRFGIFHNDVKYLEIGAKENILALLA